MANKKQTQMTKTQHDKFVEAARELECDDSEEAFRSKLKKLTEAPPSESVEGRKKKRSR
jgi:hypothetical protein